MEFSRKSSPTWRRSPISKSSRPTRPSATRARLPTCSRSRNSSRSQTCSKAPCREKATRCESTSQLINAQSDSHLWAEKYDRKSTDVFAVESEIAKAIAETLRAKLSGSEQRAMATRPTTNPDAYLLYLRALPYEQGPDTLLGDYQQAVALYEQAIQLDPRFCPGPRTSRFHLRGDFPLLRAARHLERSRPAGSKRRASSPA